MGLRQHLKEHKEMLKEMRSIDFYYPKKDSEEDENNQGIDQFSGKVANEK
jgi:hypothetical protein